MKDLKNKILFERLGLFKQNINSALKQEEFKKVISEMKSLYDKQQLLAYYDVRFNVLNENRLVENLKEIRLNKAKKRYNLLFINLKDLNKRYYSSEKDIVVNTFKKIVKKFKTELKQRKNSVYNEEFYLYNDSLVFLVNNDKIRKFYRFVKSVMREFTILEWKIYFEELENKQTKSLKSLETCYLRVLDKINNNQEDELVNKIENKE